MNVPFFTKKDAFFFLMNRFENIKRHFKGDIWNHKKKNCNLIFPGKNAIIQQFERPHFPNHANELKSMKNQHQLFFCQSFYC